MAHGLFVAAQGLLSSCGGQAQYLQHTGSLDVARGLSSCRAQSWLPRGMWDLSSPTRDRTPKSLALEGGFFFFFWKADS